MLIVLLHYLKWKIDSCSRLRVQSTGCRKRRKSMMPSFLYVYNDLTCVTCLIIVCLWCWNAKKEKSLLTGVLDDTSSIFRVLNNKTIAKTNLENSIMRWTKLSKMKKKSTIEDLNKCLTRDVASFLSKKYLKDFNSAHQNPQFESISYALYLII